MISLLLLMRQYIANQGEEGITLEDMEELENYSFDELVEKSHKKFEK